MMGAKMMKLNEQFFNDNFYLGLFKITDKLDKDFDGYVFRTKLKQHGDDPNITPEDIMDVLKEVGNFSNSDLKELNKYVNDYIEKGDFSPNKKWPTTAKNPKDRIITYISPRVRKLNNELSDIIDKEGDMPDDVDEESLYAADICMLYDSAYVLNDIKAASSFKDWFNKSIEGGAVRNEKGKSQEQSFKNLLKKAIDNKDIKFNPLFLSKKEEEQKLREVIRKELKELNEGPPAEDFLDKVEDNISSDIVDLVSETLLNLGDIQKKLLKFRPKLVDEVAKATGILEGVQNKLSDGDPIGEGKDENTAGYKTLKKELQDLIKQRNEVNNQLDKIVKDGGKIVLSDPLYIKSKALTAKINKLNPKGIKVNLKEVVKSILKKKKATSAEYKKMKTKK